MKFEKEELEYYWEDHKGKILFIGGAIIVGLIIAISVIVAKLTAPEPEPEPVILEEEIHVEAIDINKKKEELQEQISEEKDKEYGPAMTIKKILKETDDFYIIECISENGDYSVVFRDKSMLAEMSKIWFDFSLRGELVPFNDEEKYRLMKKDRTSRLDGYLENEEYRSVWDDAFSSRLEMEGYSADEERESIGDDIWNLCVDSAYDKLESYLLSKEDSGYAEDIADNPYDTYDNLWEMSGEWTLCNTNKEPLCELSADNFKAFFERYWDEYIVDVQDVLWYEGSFHSSKDVGSGVFYQNKYETATIFVNEADDFVVLWRIDKLHNTYTDYLWPQTAISDPEYSDRSEKVCSVTIPGDTLYFAYYYLGDKYNITDILPDKEECTAKLSDYYLSTDVTWLPRNTYYITNDTEFSLFVSFNEKEDFGRNLNPGETILLDGKTITMIRVYVSK